MKITGAKILMLGGAGLVGRHIAHLLLREKPALLILHAKTIEETSATFEELQKEFPRAKILTEAGDLFAFTGPNFQSNKSTPKSLLSSNCEDLLAPLNQSILKRSQLYQLIQKYQPDIVIDSVNTATAIAYQNLFEKAITLSQSLVKDSVGSVKKASLNLLESLYIPKLVRHLQILQESMRSGKVKLYLKIGTTGTGGMGFNIPFTHGEEKPSRMLLAKAALAGAQSQLLYLLSQTPGAPKIIEIKPATAIAWGHLGFGPIKNLRLEDESETLELKSGSNLKTAKVPAKTGQFETVYLDSGENGFFSPEEFRALSDPDQMGFITPQEITRLALAELKGYDTGHNITQALGQASLGPSEAAQKRRERAFETLRRIGRGRQESPALGFLGPPHLSKLLFEARLIKETVGLEGLTGNATAEVSHRLVEHLEKDKTLRKFALSIGLPILLPGGQKVLVGSHHKVPEALEDQKVSPQKINDWARRGWIDLRPENLKKWQERIIHFEKIKKRKARFEGELAALILETEDGGFRKKSNPSTS